MGIGLRPANLIKMESPVWLWRDWLAAGKLHLLAGRPGTGKTTVAISLAAAITNGTKFPDGEVAPQGDVLIWSGEDDVKATLTPRLYAAGADLTRCHFIVATTTGDGRHRMFDPANDVAHIEETIRKAGTPPKLLLLDPIVSFCPSTTNQGVRDSLYPIVRLAEQYGIAVIGITHVKKGKGSDFCLEGVLGAQAFGAVARVVMMTGTNPLDLNWNYLACIKNNLGATGSVFKYRVQECDFTNLDNEIRSSFIEWGGSADSATPNNPRQTELAERFLVAQLDAGPKLQTHLMELGAMVGLSQAALRRAKKSLGIRSFRDEGRWWWELPYQHVQDAQGSHNGDVEPDANVEHVERLGHLLQ